MYPDHYLVGKIIRTHGVKGDLIIFLDADEPARYLKMKTIFVEIQDELKSYKVKKVSLQSRDKSAIIHLEGVEDMNAAELLLKYNLYQPTTMLPEMKGNDFYFHEIIGYQVNDVHLGQLGIIKDVYDLPQHPVGVMLYKEKEVLIPISTQTLQKIDRENNTIFLELPDGLLEVYM